MLANAPPVFPASHVHTRGGTYGSPVIWFRSWSCSRLGPGKSAGEDDLDFWLNVSRKLYRDSVALLNEPQGGAAPQEGEWPRWRWRSAEHTYEIHTLLRISYAGFCLKQKHDRKTKHQHPH